MARPRQSFAEKFEKYAVPIPESGCWIWCGPVTRYGYGTVTRGRKKSLHAHRAAYEERFGEVSSDLVVRHTCDVKLCVNINHLIVGTQKQNIEDKDVKTTGYNIYPQYSYPRPCPMNANYPCVEAPTQITSYQVIQSFQVKVRDLDKVSSA